MFNEPQQKIIITRRNGKRLTAVWQDQRVVEWVAEEEDPELTVGDICLAQVKNVVRNMEAVFLDILPEQPCFMPLEKGAKRPAPGDVFPVVVTREGTALKAPRVSQSLSLTGRHIVLITDKKQVAVSVKIRSQARRDALTALLSSLAEKETVGYIVRTNAENAPNETILKEAEALILQLEGIRQTALHRPPFTRLYASGRASESIIRDHPDGIMTEVLTDQTDIYEELSRLPYFDLDGELSLRLYEDSYPLDKCYRLDHFLQIALERRVWLKSGGFLIIDYTEALTVIDVNTGKYDGHKNKEETFFKINLEACLEIGYQLRLRNLSGIILVDFIDMEEEEHQQQVQRLLRETLAKDPQKAVLVDITKLNLAEITRKKVRMPLWMSLKDFQKIT